MAKITTITNPLTGQPAQVDQLEHTAQEIDDAIARALPGGAIDITLQNKAPAGYGIGEEDLYAERVKDADLDTLKKGGTYFIATGCTNTPPNTDEAWSTLHVIPGRACTQIFIPANDTSLAGTFTSWIARIYNDKTAAWGAWEWVNPPMALGVEYRTTEQYLGKPVYTMCIDCGMSENNKIIRVTPENGLSALIRGYVVLGGEPAFFIVGGDFSNSYSKYANVDQDGGQIKIDLHQGSSVASRQTYAIVYYTKE